MTTAKKLTRAILRGWRGYLVGVVLVVLATWLKQLAQPNVIPPDVPILYLVAIVPTAMLFGFGPAILVCILSLLAFDYFFVPPLNQITYDLFFAPLLVIFLAVGILFSYLTSNLRRKNLIATREIKARKQSEAELMKYRDHLEDLVQQRTTEVEKANRDLKDEIARCKETEEALRESEERWVTTLASIGDAVIATDSAGKITFMNPVAEALTGWTFGEASGQPASEVVHILNEKTRESVENPIDRVIREGIIVGLANHTILVRKDRTEVPIDDSGAPILDDNKRIIGVVLIFRDVTEQRKAEQLKDEFIGMVSHELRTPLTIVSGAVHTAMLEGLPPKELPVLLQEAASGTESLAGILENLIELSRHQANRLNLNVEPINIRQVIDEVVVLFRGKSPIHQIKIEGSEQLPPISADKVRVERILHNLLENAVKYSPQGGEIRILARQDGSSLVVGVSDRGIGISTENQAGLFQPFQRLSDQKGIKGLGLGLSVCRRLVEAHGGRIWAESEPGKGSTFWFSIPLPASGDYNGFI